MISHDAAVAENGEAGSYSERPRIALYSHDTMGIGHMRRNLLIAQTLAAAPTRPAILMIAGAREASAFSMPAGTDCLTLPAFQKEGDGRYEARNLLVPIKELVSLRGRTIAAALDAFSPDLFIVDKEPRGALLELDPVLKALRMRGGVRCVLGLRDVLDAPTVVRREWRERANADTVRDYYDAVWIYGDPAVYDQVREYGLPEAVAKKVRYTGYLDARARYAYQCDLSCKPDFPNLDEPYVLCTVGGGQDGDLLAETFVHSDFPAGLIGVMLTGPFMPRDVSERLHRRAAENSRLRILEFVADAHRLVKGAERIVAMGGYNTICEILSFGKRALIVPRVQPRQEQLIRAKRLQELGLIDVLTPAEVTATSISDWLARDAGPPLRACDRLDMKGTVRLADMLKEVLPDRSASIRIGSGVPHACA